MTAVERAGLIEAARQLTVSRVDSDWVLGRPDLGIYVAVPEPGAVFVETLQASGSLAEATAAASAVAGEDVDGEDFLDGLAGAGLLDTVSDSDGTTAATAATDDGAGRGRRVRWIEVVSPRVARRLFGPVAWTLYAAAALFAAGVLVVRADLRPTFEDLWFLPDPVLSVLAIFVLGQALAALHEAWHWLAGRAAGVPAAFRVSYRGYFLVFETDLTQLVSLPRRQRYGPFGAGMAFDGVVLAVALGLRLAWREELVWLPATVDRLLGAVVIAQVFALGWQCAGIFLRSDGYAVLANALRCNNLYRATWLTTKDRLLRLTTDEQAELAEIGEHDRRVARWFGLFYVVGMLALCWLLVNFGLPFVVSMGVWVVNNVAAGQPSSLAFWEALAVLLLLVLRVAAPPLLAHRERRLRKAGALL